MTTPPTWVLQSGSQVNAEGNQITLNVKVTTPFTGGSFSDTDVLDVEMMLAKAGDSAHLAQIGDIFGWRFDDNDGTLWSSRSTGFLGGAGLSDWTGPTHTGSNWEVTFKYRLDLTGKGRIAINNGSAGVAIDGLASDWLTLYFIDNTAGPFGAPAVLNTDPNLTISAVTVGLLPTGQDVAGDALKVFVDAHAEGVAQGTAVPNLGTWTDLSGFGNNLTGEPSTDKPYLYAGDATRAHVDFAIVASAAQRFRTGSSPPVITSPATIAAVFKANTAASVAQIVGRYNWGTSAWRVYFDGSAAAKKVDYQANGPGGAVTQTFTLDSNDTTVLFTLRRKEDASKTWEVWLNGRPTDNGTFSNGVNTGTGYISVGARDNGTIGWADGFTGEINQVALYDVDITDLELSLLMHQMADRAVIALGTPVPSAWRNQPYITSASARHLDRRPIALINLYGAHFNDNIFGQSPSWRDSDGASAIVANLKPRILRAMYACDQFEIMFNRPGGDYADEPATSYVFGSKDGTDIITADQWEAMATLWDDLNLSDANDDQTKDANHRPQRRAWFYTGAGLPLDDDGHLDTTGYMRTRQIAPAVPSVYYDNILVHWSNQDDRYRCLFVDAASNFYGKFVEMVHDSQTNGDFLLVGEAIPSDDGARLGAPWFSLVRFGSAPWWNNSDSGQGYNPSWESEWQTRPIYFGVNSDGYPNLYNILSDPFGGSNLKVGDIYRWILKGATPVSWSPETYIKVGVAWNYATARVMPSRLVRNPRSLRMARS